MKKYMAFSIIFIFIFIVLFMTYFGIGMDYILLVSGLFIILSFLFLFEIKGIDSKKISVIATLSAIGAASRIPFASVPGFQPVTFITAVSGYALGPVNGFMVGTLCAFISNFFLGQGPWTLWQMLGWGLCGAFFGLIKPAFKKFNIIVFIVLCGFWGYIYGIILDMWYIVAFVRPFNIKAVIAGIAASFYFDTSHAVSNVIFSAIFGKSFIKILDRYNKKCTIEHVDEIEEN